MAFKYGAYTYATYIGPTSAATTVLGAIETNARKQVATATLPAWSANWRLCTEQYSVTSTVHGIHQTMNYGKYDADVALGVITNATGYVYTGNISPPTIPTNNQAALVYQFGYENYADINNRGNGYFNGHLYMRRITK